MDSPPRLIWPDEPDPEKSEAETEQLRQARAAFWSRMAPPIYEARMPVWQWSCELEWD